MKFSKEYAYSVCPKSLQESIKQYEKAEKKFSKTKEWTYLEGPYCELQSEINKAEVEQYISSELAWYMRKVYLNIDKDEL